MLECKELTPLEREYYEEEVQPYQKIEYKPIIYIYHVVALVDMKTLFFTVRLQNGQHYIKNIGIFFRKD